MKHSLYDEQTVEDEAMLFCGELSDEGVSSDEIAYGLWPVMACFAGLMRDGELRKGMAELLEGLAHDLRTQPFLNADTQPEMQRVARHNIALVRLQHLAEQEGRALIL